MFNINNSTIRLTIYLTIMKYMDSSSFASDLPVVDWGSTAHVYPVSIRALQVRNHDGLFARRLPGGGTGSQSTVEVGFCRRRFDLFAISQNLSFAFFGQPGPSGIAP